MTRLVAIRVDDDMETLYELVGEGAELELVYRSETDQRNAWQATVEALATFAGADATPGGTPWLRQALADERAATRAGAGPAFVADGDGAGGARC